MFNKFILLAEDDIAINEILKFTLEDEFPGFDIVAVLNGAEAVEVLTVNASKGIVPEIVITDLMMPLLSGVELVEFMKSQELLKSVPVIIQSGSIITKDLASDSILYMDKPLVLDDLVSHTKNLMGLSYLSPVLA